MSFGVQPLPPATTPTPTTHRMLGCTWFNIGTFPFFRPDRRHGCLAVRFCPRHWWPSSIVLCDPQSVRTGARVGHSALEIDDQFYCEQERAPRVRDEGKGGGCVVRRGAQRRDRVSCLVVPASLPTCTSGTSPVRCRSSLPFRRRTYAPRGCNPGTRELGSSSAHT